MADIPRIVLLLDKLLKRLFYTPRSHEEYLQNTLLSNSMTQNLSFPALTATAHTRITRAVNQYQNRLSDIIEPLEESLGANNNFGKSYMLSFPYYYDGNCFATGQSWTTDQSGLVLKLCRRCLEGELRQDCFIDQEAWVWREAKRRGDSKLFAPVIAADRNNGWEVMQRAPLTTLPGVAINGRMHGYQMQRHFLGVLKRRGWVPHDAEPMAINQRPVVIDYEDMYHQDVFTGLYMHSLKQFPGGKRYSPRSLRAFK